MERPSNPGQGMSRMDFIAGCGLAAARVGEILVFQRLSLGPVLAEQREPENIEGLIRALEKVPVDREAENRFVGVVVPIFRRIEGDPQLREKYPQIYDLLRKILTEQDLNRAHSLAAQFIEYLAVRGYLLNLAHSEGNIFNPIHTVRNVQCKEDRGLRSVLPIGRIPETRNIYHISDPKLRVLGSCIYATPMMNDATMEEWGSLYWGSSIFSSPPWNDFSFEDFVGTLASNELIHSVLSSEYDFGPEKEMPWAEAGLSDASTIDSKQAYEFLSDVASLNKDPRYIFLIASQMLLGLSATGDSTLQIVHNGYHYSRMVFLRELSSIFKKLGREQELGEILMSAAKSEETSGINKHLKTILSVLASEDLEAIRAAFTVRGQKLMGVIDRHTIRSL